MDFFLQTTCSILKNGGLHVISYKIFFCSRTETLSFFPNDSKSGNPWTHIRTVCQVKRLQLSGNSGGFPVKK